MASGRQSVVSQNLSLKLVSLLLAILLELYFYSPDNALTVWLPATIVVRNVPQSLMFIAPRHGERGIPARISVRGPRPLIERLRTTPQQLNFDYPPGEPMVFSLSVDRHQLSLPAGVELVDVEPESIAVELDRVITRDVPVQLDLGSVVPEGYLLSESSVTPSTVALSGPEREMERLPVVRTEHIDLSEVREERALDVRLQLPEGFLKAQPDVLAAKISVKPIPAQRVFDKIPVGPHAPPGFAGTVEPSKVRATLVGPKELLDQLQNSEVELRAATNGLSEGRHETGIEADLPNGVLLFATDPKKVIVTLMKEGTGKP